MTDEQTPVQERWKDRDVPAQPLPYPDPALSDGRIGLRRWREADIECIRLAGTDTNIPKGTTVPTIYTPDEGRAFIRRQWARVDNRQGVSQAIIEIDGDRAIGLMWVALRPQPHVGGLGYWIVPSERGRGAATAAVDLVVPWALNVLDLRRLEAWVEPENLASQRVLRRAGFREEGHLRNFLPLTTGLRTLWCSRSLRARIDSDPHSSAAIREAERSPRVRRAVVRA